MLALIARRLARADGVFFLGFFRSLKLELEEPVEEADCVVEPEAKRQRIGEENPGFSFDRCDETARDKFPKAQQSEFQSAEEPQPSVFEEMEWSRTNPTFTRTPVQKSFTGAARQQYFQPEERMEENPLLAASNIQGFSETFAVPENVSPSDNIGGLTGSPIRPEAGEEVRQNDVFDAPVPERSGRRAHLVRSIHRSRIFG